MKYCYRHVVLILAVLLCQTSWAGSTIDNLDDPGFTQNLFKDLTSDLGAALGYKAISSGEPLGVTGFELGLSVSGTRMETDALEQATTSNAPGTLLVPKLEVTKGLPYGFDVGGFYSTIPSSNIELIGGNVSYSIIDGGVLSPTLSIRGTYTRLTGVNDLDLTTRGLELSISKGFTLFTPYAGIGSVWIDGDTSVSGLSSESLNEYKYFMGFSLELGLMNFAAETEQTGDNTSTSAKIGVRF